MNEKNNDLPGGVSKAEVIRRLLSDGRLTCKQIAAKYGIGERYVFAVQRRMRCVKDGPANGKCSPSPVKTVSLETLIDQERLDPRRILREGLKSIPEGEVAMDETLRRDLQISAEVWRRVSRDDEFLPFRALLPSRRAVWGRAKTIQTLKEQDGVI